MHHLLTLTVLFAATLVAHSGTTVYQKPSDFIRSACGGQVPTTKYLTLTSSNQSRIKRLMGHEYRPTRVRYWTYKGKMVVILDEIGKTRPITTGFVVSSGKIESVKMLIYRETIGAEVRRTTFTNQFKGATLGSSGKLSRRVNNIAGATLSTRAMMEMGRVALYMDQIRPK
ncbi:MAG: FMN-binding protein [Roseibacillus sp.]|nr:FMN-binding protein [Roseibacillus sp.]|tara:strand:+ start:17581 stop:18093 length:513 start_codon:yes stop_codon:yes gene_type:complete